MLDDIYNRRILELAADIPRLGRLHAPDASATAHSKLCGSTVTVDLSVKDGTVTDFAHEVKACALGQAAAGVVGENILGATAAEILEARDAMLAMLKSGGEGPVGRFEGLRVLKQVADYPARHASTMVALEAVLDAVNQAQELALAKHHSDTRTRLAGAA